VSQETPYRIAVSLVALGSMVTAGYHRIQAARAGEPVSHREEGPALFWAIRLCGVALFVSMIAYLVAPDAWPWARVPLPGAVRWIGAGLGVATIGMLYWTLSTLGTNLTDTVVTRTKHTLVREGPYRWVRHPFYVSMVLLIAATSLLAASWLIAASGLLLFVFLAIRTPREEQKLVERFGDEYRDYMRRTARYVPGVW
jgi:protein-S-isoprenylcysteine O-methyltransferase Ste14